MGEKMFPRWISKQLVKNDMSQRELSEQLGIHESLVSRWMKGERVPTLPRIIKLSSIFGVGVEEILKKMGKLDV
jgi:transcriptional regulator with XRE-family HTH domain